MESKKIFFVEKKMSFRETNFLQKRKIEFSFVGSGCGAEVEHPPLNEEVIGSKPASFLTSFDFKTGKTGSSLRYITADFLD